MGSLSRQLVQGRREPVGRQGRRTCNIHGVGTDEEGESQNVRPYVELRRAGHGEVGGERNGLLSGALAGSAGAHRLVVESKYAVYAILGVEIEAVRRVDEGTAKMRWDEDRGLEELSLFLGAPPHRGRTRLGGASGSVLVRQSGQRASAKEVVR